MEIKCAYTDLVDIDLIVPNPLNPNEHDEEQINVLQKIMNHRGIRHPLIISKRSDFLNCGHGRLLAFKKEGLKKVPVDYQDFENEADEFANMVADNKAAGLAKHNDAFMIETIQANVDLKAMDFELMGLVDFDIEQMPKEEQNNSGELDLSDFDNFQHECPKCSFQWNDNGSDNA